MLHNSSSPYEGIPDTLRSVGIGLPAASIPEFLATQPSIGWVEVQAESYMYVPVAVRALAAVRRDYDLSLHSVGLSLGSTDGLQSEHMRRLASLVTALEPQLVSDHLSWSTTGGKFLNALLPLPYTTEALHVVCRNIDATQHALGRKILVENVTAYVRFRHSEMTETEFLMEVVQRTGCGILCDVNNIYVSSLNFGTDPLNFIRAISPDAVGQFHLGGHSRIRCGDKWLLFDDHGSSVTPAVWELYRVVLNMLGAKPTLIEWDTNRPSLAVLLAEARRASETTLKLSKE